MMDPNILPDWVLALFIAAIFGFLLFLVWLAFVGRTLADNFSRKDLGARAQAGWAILIVLLPVIGIVLYRRRSRPPSRPPPSPSVVVEGLSEQRAGFAPRVVAFLVDCVLITILVTVLAGVPPLDSVPELALTFAVAMLYFVFFDGRSGQTPGKRIFGIRVVGADSDASIGYTRALLRYFGLIVASVPFGLGYLWMLWDREKQGWQDKLANDVVVPARVHPPPSWP